MSERIVGGWTSFDFTLTPQAKDALETALQGLVGARYTPLAFASQVVAGTNYAFLCEAEYTTDYPNENAVMVRVYQPITGRAHLVSITAIRP